MNESLKGGILVFLGACSFGFLSTIVKFAYAQGYTLGEVTGSQTTCGMVTLWLLYALFKQLKRTKHKNTSPEISGTVQPNKKRTPWWQIALAGCFTGLVGIFYYQSIKFLPASLAIILLMQYLWISTLIEAVVFKKKPTLRQLVLVFVVLAGSVLAAGLLTEKASSFDPVGVGYGLLAACCYAIFLISSGRVGNELPVLKKSAWMITGSCFITWVIFPPLFLINGVFTDGLYLWGMALALLGTVIPPFFFSAGVPRVGVAIGSILSAAELPVATFSSVLFLHESVGVIRWLGVVIILLAIAASNLQRKPSVRK